MGFRFFFCRFPNSHRPQTFRSAAQVSTLASALGGCPQVISGLVLRPRLPTSTAKILREWSRRGRLRADGDVMMRIDGRPSLYQSICVFKRFQLSAPMQVSPPLPIPRQMSSSVIVSLRRVLPASRPRRAAIRPSPLAGQWFYNLSSPAAFRRMFLVIVGLRLALSASHPRRAVFRPSLLGDQRFPKFPSPAFHRWYPLVSSVRRKNCIVGRVSRTS
jgi:hypothetical protein